MSFSPISHAIGFGLIAWFYMAATQVDTAERYVHIIILHLLAIAKVRAQPARRTQAWASSVSIS